MEKLGATFLYPLYKAQRAQTEDDLRAQFKFIPILARYLDINLVDMEGLKLMIA